MTKAKEDELYLAHLYDVHKENSVFLNKALLSIPSALIAVLLTSFNDFQNGCSKIFVVLACIIFFIAIVIMIYSFFQASSLLNRQLSEEATHEEVVDSLDSGNIVASVIVVFGFLCVIIAISLEYIV